MTAPDQLCMPTGVYVLRHPQGDNLHNCQPPMLCYRHPETGKVAWQIKRGRWLIEVDDRLIIIPGQAQPWIDYWLERTRNVPGTPALRYFGQVFYPNPDLDANPHGTLLPCYQRDRWTMWLYQGEPHVLQGRDIVPLEGHLSTEEALSLMEVAVSPQLLDQIATDNRQAAWHATLNSYFSKGQPAVDPNESRRIPYRNTRLDYLDPDLVQAFPDGWEPSTEQDPRMAFARLRHLLDDCGLDDHHEHSERILPLARRVMGLWAGKSRWPKLPRLLAIRLQWRLDGAASFRCPSCDEKLRLASGSEVYPDHLDLAARQFWTCTGCRTLAACYQGTDHPAVSLAGPTTRDHRAAAYAMAVAAFGTDWVKRLAGHAIRINQCPWTYRPGLMQAPALDELITWLKGKVPDQTMPIPGLMGSF